MSLPEAVQITEVGPRDGLQMEPRVVPTDLKVELIAGLADAGVPAIQVAAFVHPGRMPQMADAEALIARLPARDVQFSALSLNLKGVERACRTAIPWIEISLSASDAHSRSNAGLTLGQAVQEARGMAALAVREGRKVRASIQCAFGYATPLDVDTGQVTHLAERLLEQGIDLLVLADTAGLADPQVLAERLAKVLPMAGTVPVGLHLHDTRGQGMANVRAALALGITRFDTGLGGLGGCPFIPGAAGNIATEATVAMLQGLGIGTGIDAAKVAAWTRRLNCFFGKSTAPK